MMTEREKTGSLLLAKWTPSDSFSLAIRSERQFSLVLGLLFVLPLFRPLSEPLFVSIVVYGRILINH